MSLRRRFQLMTACLVAVAALGAAVEGAYLLAVLFALMALGVESWLRRRAVFDAEVVQQLLGAVKQARSARQQPRSRTNPMRRQRAPIQRAFLCPYAMLVQAEVIGRSVLIFRDELPEDAWRLLAQDITTLEAVSETGSIWTALRERLGRRGPAGDLEPDRNDASSGRA
ncbi:MAG: hypothetical protein NZ533_02090 [Casimicrobiaceae bacterium]|nr:hypothetical protein [Casimicrobiaceae bacterium]MDW8311301.1 hypothetical protein [Burkholderiales bacterium]